MNPIRGIANPVGRKQLKHASIDHKFSSRTTFHIDLDPIPGTLYNQRKTRKKNTRIAMWCLQSPSLHLEMQHSCQNIKHVKTLHTKKLDPNARFKKPINSMNYCIPRKRGNNQTLRNVILCLCMPPKLQAIRVYSAHKRC